MKRLILAALAAAIPSVHLAATSGQAPTPTPALATSLRAFSRASLSRGNSLKSSTKQ